jgi:hypothetical protein
VAGSTTLLGGIFCQLVYVESTPALQLSSADISSKSPISRSALTLRMSPLSPTTTTKPGHRASSSVALSDLETETLVGSPHSPTRKGAELDDIPDTNTGHTGYAKDIDEEDEGAAEGLLKRYPPSPGTASKEDLAGLREKKAGGWTFWDLMAWRPMRVMCMTMFMNS